ncbi:MAG: hypothetical protein M0R03_15675 [Novosphingobium sp.]|nr:hypothetical protein [Novosphingobium sp.]
MIPIRRTDQVSDKFAKVLQKSVEEYNKLREGKLHTESTFQYNRAYIDSKVADKAFGKNPSLHYWDSFTKSSSFSDSKDNDKTSKEFSQYLDKVATLQEKVTKLPLKKALATKKFSYKEFDLYKEADTDEEFGRIWVRKEVINEKTGEKEEWLVVYTSGDDEMIRQIANEGLKELNKKVSFKKVALDLDAIRKYPQYKQYFFALQDLMNTYYYGAPVMAEVGANYLSDKFPELDDIEAQKILNIWLGEVAPFSETLEGSNLGGLDTFNVNTGDSISLSSKKIAANPNPKDVPIAPGIKSKNITIDESGAQGTAKVTVEFSDVDQGLEFYQNDIATGNSAKTEEKPEESTDQSQTKPNNNLPDVENAQPQVQGPQVAPGPIPPMAQSSLKSDKIKKEGYRDNLMRDYQEPPQQFQSGEVAEIIETGQIGIVQQDLGDTVKLDINGSPVERLKTDLKKRAMNAGEWNPDNPYLKSISDSFGQPLSIGDPVRNEKGRRGVIDALDENGEATVTWTEPSSEMIGESQFDHEDVSVVPAASLTKWATPTVRKMSSKGMTVVDIIKEVRDRSVKYAYVNENGLTVNLQNGNVPIENSQLYRPDTKQMARVGKIIERKYASLKSVAEEIIADMDKEIPGTVEDASLTEASMKKKVAFLVRKGKLKEGKYSFAQLNKLAYEEDYDYYHDNFTPDDDAECEHCGALGAKYYNQAGQKLNFGGFATDKLLCDRCAEEEFKDDKFASIANSLVKEALDVSDQIAPMDWTTDSGVEQPAGAGPALQPKPELQNNPNDPSSANVVYDTNKGQSPSFQTTIDPNDQSVKIKFIPNEQQQQLDQTVNQNQQQQMNQPAPPIPNSQPQQVNPLQQQKPDFGDMNIPNQF